MSANDITTNGLDSWLFASQRRQFVCAHRYFVHIASFRMVLQVKWPHNKPDTQNSAICTCLLP